MINVLIIGYGYWGPKLARNFSNSNNFNLHSICDLNSNNLHKLNTTKINFEQILKSLDIYDQKFSTITDGNAIDHLWSVFSKHWPCNN